VSPNAQALFRAVFRSSTSQTWPYLMYTLQADASGYFNGYAGYIGCSSVRGGEATIVATDLRNGRVNTVGTTWVPLNC
jgi:hypothetical protein